MNRPMIRKNWYMLFVGILFLGQLLSLTVWKDHSFIAIHDNLDLFVAHNTMMKRAGIFFEQDVTAPMLGGISRDLLGSEFSLYNLLYFVFPPYAAYVLGYFLKIAIGFCSSLLLAREVYGREYARYRPLVWLVASGFCMIPVFPAYGICFTSIPLVVVLLRRIYLQPGPVWYGLLFFYPWLSYFSYFGFFLLAYLSCGVIILWCINRKFPLLLALCVPVLGLGYVAWEYRLFGEILFGGQINIRSSMVGGDLSLSQSLDLAVESLLNPGFHAEDSHRYLILWVCLIILLAVNMINARRGRRRFFHEPINLVSLVIVFNCLVYGFYQFKPFREMFEKLIPPLEGFQFNRTIYFNSFLWYLLFFLCLKWVWDFCHSLGQPKKSSCWESRGKGIACVTAALGTLVCMLMPQVYNDFSSNIYHHGYEIVKGQRSSQLSFKEFYSQELFDRIKEEIDYRGEWAVAYGMHPAVLQYNGISTLDGYLGMYSLDYKERFRRVIAPALENSLEFRITFDSLGARAYLYSGAAENTYVPARNLELQDRKLYIDSDALRELGGVYIFSRIVISNAEELGLRLIGDYKDAGSPYHIFVYRLEG